MPNKDDLQTLIDLPSGECHRCKEPITGDLPDDGMIYVSGAERYRKHKRCPVEALATELRDRRAFDEWLTVRGQNVIETLSGKFCVKGSTDETRFRTPFEAWQNAKEAGEL